MAFKRLKYSGLFFGTKNRQSTVGYFAGTLGMKKVILFARVFSFVVHLFGAVYGAGAGQQQYAAV